MNLIGIIFGKMKIDVKYNASCHSTYIKLNIRQKKKNNLMETEIRKIRIVAVYGVSNDSKDEQTYCMWECCIFESGGDCTGICL